MGQARSWIAVAAGLAMACGGGAARADESPKKGEHTLRLPISYTERPLTLPRLILSPEGEFSIDHDDTLGTTTIGLTLSARFGITDDLEAYAVVAPLLIGPFGGADPGKFGYGNPTLGATYRFVRNRLELGATLGVTIVHQIYDPTAIVPAYAVQSGVILEPGVAFRFHITKEALLEGGVYLPIEFGGVDPNLAGESSAGVGFRVPLAFAYDITEPFHVGARSGVGLFSFNAPTEGSVSENLYIPLGVFGGYAVAGKSGPLLDIDGFFTWPHLLTPSSEAHAATAAQTSHPGDFSVGVSLGGFLYF